MKEPPDENRRSPETQLAERSESPLAIPQKYPLVSKIEQRIVEAKDAKEAAFFVQVRDEVIRQDTQQKKEDFAIKAQRRGFWFRVGSSAAFLATGAGLVVGGFTLPGFFMIGGSVALVAPDYAKHFVKTVMGRNEGNE